MNRPNIHGAIVTLKEWELCRKAEPPKNLELNRVYVDVRSGDLVQLLGLVAPEGCVEAKRCGGGRPFFLPQACLRERVNAGRLTEKDTSCLAILGQLIVYGLLAIVILFGLVFGFCALGGAHR